MRVTRSWLLKCLPEKGSHNKQQIRLLGLSYPLPAGWMKQVEGLEIPDGAAREFERLSGKVISWEETKADTPVVLKDRKPNCTYNALASSCSPGFVAPKKERPSRRVKLEPGLETLEVDLTDGQS